MGGDQLLRRDVQRIGGEHEIGFVVGEEFEHRAEHLPVGQPLAQDLGREAGEREKALRAVVILQDPAERGERQRIGIAGGMIGMMRFANDLSASFELRKAPFNGEEGGPT